MSVKLQPLAGMRQDSETDKAVQACNDWLRLGPGRSLPGLLQKYSEMQQNAAPTRSKSTLSRWSANFNWSVRAAEYDATYEQRKNEERDREINYGLALDYERIRKLKRLAGFLETQIYEQDDDQQYCNVWVEDAKQIGSGKDAERVDIVRFNGSLIQQYRDVLDDLAKEVGDRVKKIAGTGPNGEIEVHNRVLMYLPDNGRGDGGDDDSDE